MTTQDKNTLSLNDKRRFELICAIAAGYAARTNLNPHFNDEIIRTADDILKKI